MPVRDSAPLRLLITGGAGFLGQALSRELRDEAARRGRAVHLRLFDLKPAPGGGGADEVVTGDVRDAAAVRAACADRDVVIHAASAVDWGNTPVDFLRAVNVDGTRHVIDGCRGAGVRGLVYTSTLDVLFDGARLDHVDERHPYPARHLDHYGSTKTEAERLVLGADDAAGLRTMALRPLGMYGEADPYHVGSVLKAARTGQLSFRIGDGSAVFQHVYVGNVAHAHAQAAFALGEGGAAAAAMGGRPYFVTDQEAENFFDFMAPFVEALGHRMPKRKLPRGLALGIAAVVEGAAKLVRPLWNVQPLLTRSSVIILTTYQSYDGSALRRDLGWAPRYTTAEAFRRTVDWFLAHPG